MEQTIDLKALFLALLRRWKEILAGSVVGIIIAYVLSTQFMEPMYSSNFSFYINTGEQVSASSAATAVYQEQLASQSVVPDLIKVMQQGDLMKQVAELLNTKYASDLNTKYGVDGIISEGLVAGSVSFSSVQDSRIISVLVTTVDADLSKNICVALEEAIPPMLSKLARVDAETFGIIKANTNPVSPNVPKNMFLGAFFGFFIIAFIVFLFFFFDTRISDSSTFEAKFGVSVLGKIPDFHKLKAGKEYRYYGKNK